MCRRELMIALEDSVARATPADYPALIGDLGRLIALVWSRMTLSLDGENSNRAAPRIKLLAIPEVAALLAIPSGRAYELARQGKLPTVKIGKYVRVETAALDGWIAKNRDGRLDPEVYTVYSSGRRDRRGTPKGSQAARSDSSRSSRQARGHGKHRGTVGARRGTDPRTDGSDDLAAGS